MRRRDRRHQDAAATAITHAVHDAILMIRTMAYCRERPSVIFPEADDYQEEIRLLADLCDTLIPGLRRDLLDYRPVDALQYTWDSRNDHQRRWLTETLAQHDIALTDFIIDNHRRA
ncbi:hypothetical protein [Kribbella sp. CA-294648]|uniref:hypothetical protein n=1 Tax=Kribbella sp. CA-294648 TaxID=3239948 RepID=UPI003D8B2422